MEEMEKTCANCSRYGNKRYCDVCIGGVGIGKKDLWMQKEERYWPYTFSEKANAIMYAKTKGLPNSSVKEIQKGIYAVKEDKKSTDKWMQKAFKEHTKGSLHRQLKVPHKEKIPKELLTKVKETPIGEKVAVDGHVKVTRLLKKRATLAHTARFFKRGRNLVRKR